MHARMVRGLSEVKTSVQTVDVVLYNTTTPYYLLYAALRTEKLRTDPNSYIAATVLYQPSELLDL